MSLLEEYLKAEREIAQGDKDAPLRAFSLLERLRLEEPEALEELGSTREQRLYDLHTSLGKPYRKPS